MKRVTMILALLLATGCGTTLLNFNPLFPDNRANDVASMQLLLQSATPQTPNVAVGLTEDSKMFAVNLDAGSVSWTVDVEGATSAPHVAGEFVVLHESSGIVVRSLETGRTYGSFDDETLFVAGAAGEGEYAIVCMSTAGGVGSRSRMVLLRNGRVFKDRYFEDTTLGAPGAAAGRYFVPWSTQNISVIDPRTGEELSRFRQNTALIGHAMVADGQLYFGQRGLFRLTPETATSEGAPYFELPERELPGTPTFLRDPYNPPPSPTSAVHRVRTGWHPAGQGNVIAPSDDVVYLTYFNTVFGLHTSQDEVLWAHSMPADLVGMVARPGGVLLADAEGSYHFLAAEDGRERWIVETNQAATVVSLRAESFSQNAAPTEPVVSVDDQLLAVAQNPDSRLVAARAFAVRMLAARPGGTATHHLVAICSDARTTATIKADACTAIGQRTEGGEHVLESLRRHAGYLEETTAPPVAALAQAAARMELREATPLLISHLNDPATPVDDLADVFKALAVLGDATVGQPVRDFLRLYHADEDSRLTEALSTAANTLVALEGPTARETLEEVIADPLTPNDARGPYRDALDSIEEPETEESNE